MRQQTARPGVRTRQRRAAPTAPVGDLLASARTCIGSGDLPHAHDLCQRAFDQEPTNPEPLNLLGVIAYRVGRADMAASLIGRAIRLQPAVPTFHLNLGLARQRLGHLADATASFEQALALEPDLVDAHRALADTLERREELGEAESRYQRLLDLAPGDEHAATSLTRVRRTVADREKYRADLLAVRRSPYLDYPAHVHIETLTLCNASCTFCPYSKLSRKGERMPDYLIDKIIEDLTEIPRDLSFTISPFKVSDPFLDRRIFGTMRKINDRLPNARIALTTNGAALTEANLERLCQVKNIEYLWISVNDHRRHEYEATMGLPYERMLDRLAMLSRHAAGGMVPFPIHLSRVSDGSMADQDFLTWCQNTYPHFRAFVNPRGDWLGQVETSVAGVPDVGCLKWFEISITSSGVVAHCCMDGQAAYPVGDVREASVLEIYNTPSVRQLRERTASRRDVSPCNQCTFF